jgi:uncharacterized protein YndB with AHSA1/START domain
MKKNDDPIIVEQTYKTSIEKVWSAITEVDQMKKWYFDNIPAFKAEIGFETQFNVENEGRVFPHVWQVTEAIPNKIIVYTWRFEGYKGDSIVAFELFEENDLVRLQLRLTILEDFADDIPEFRRESCIGGWNYFLKDRLKEYLESNN